MVARIGLPRRVGSTYLLSGLVKCKACGRALSGQDAKSGQFSYYVCQSIMKRGKDACVTPRLNARRFEQMIVDKIRSNILTEGSITELVRAVDEEMDGIASEQRKRLRTIEDELEDVKRRLGRIWNAIETSDIDIADASDRIKEHRERKERLEGCGDRRQGDPLPAQGVPRRCKHHRGLRQGYERFPAIERADRAQGLHRVLRQGDHRHSRRRSNTLYGAYAGRQFLAGRATERVALDASVLSTVPSGPPPLTVDTTIFEMWLGSLSTHRGLAIPVS